MSWDRLVGRLVLSEQNCCSSVQKKGMSVGLSTTEDLLTSTWCDKFSSSSEAMNKCELERVSVSQIFSLRGGGGYGRTL